MAKTKPRFVTIDTDKFIGGQIPTFNDTANSFDAATMAGLTQEVYEFPDKLSFPATGVVETIYTALDTDFIYRWDVGTSDYVQIGGGGGLTLGTTSSTAYRGDRGKAAYDHSKLTTGNPHNVNKGDVSLSAVTNDVQLKAADLDTDTTLAADSDTKVPSQKAVKKYVDDNAGASVTRVASTASSATPTPNVDTTDQFILTAQAATAAFANPTGTPASGQKLLIEIYSAAAQTMSWGTNYVARGYTLPLTTVAGKWTGILFVYSAAASKFAAVGGYQEE